MKLVVVGLGQCGGRIADEFARLNARAHSKRGMTIVTGCFAVNTDAADLSGLSSIKNDHRHRILIGGRKTGGHGVGKINELGAEVAKEDADKIVESVAQSMRPEHFARDQKARIELLVTKTAGKKITPLILTLKIGGETRKEQDAFGTEKFIYILSGGLDAVIGEKTYSLKCGDSLYFDSSLPHMFKNRSRAEAGAILVIAPPVS